MENKKINDLKNALINSQWPKCNAVAKELGDIGTEEAKNALIVALKESRQHHSREAAINELIKFNDESVLDHIGPLLADKSYTTRITAKKAFFTLTGREVETAKGE